MSGAKTSPEDPAVPGDPEVTGPFSREQPAARAPAPSRRRAKLDLRIFGNLAFLRWRRFSMLRTKAMATAETDTERLLDRAAAIERFRAGRTRTAGIFDVLTPDAYHDRPIELRNPIVFYEGHLPAFSVNTLLKKGLHEPGLDPRFEVLFERGIDPEDVGAVPGSPAAWPPRESIQAYGERADRAILDALQTKDITRENEPVLARGLGVHTILEHEEMHQET